MSIKRALVIPDCHRPFHSQRAYNLMIEVASFIGVDEIVLLGDYADFYPVNAYGKDPSVTHHLLEEVKSVNEGLDQLDKLWPSARKIYLEGNHEWRLERYLQNRAPELFGLTDCSLLFDINRRPLWSYHRFGRTQAYRVLGSDLLARHRPLAANAKTGLLRAMTSYCYGDIHKIEEAQSVGLDCKTRVAFCPGWLGDEHKKVFDYMQSQPQWQLGFAFVSVDSSKQFHHQIVPIKNNRCIFNGKEFKA